MSEDYLWDRSGEPEADMAHLEHLLTEFRWSGKQPEAPRASWWQGKTMAALAASVLVLLGSLFLIQKIHKPLALTSWELSVAGQQPSRVRSGQVIETGRTHATMESESIGEVDIDPNSRLRLLPAHEEGHRLALDHGTIHALIWAPPAKFVVDTPAAKAVDLGCQYTLSVAEGGRGFLTVQLGWVAFQWNGIESFIPAGAACATRVGHGPDTPYFLDAPESLTKSLAQFDLTGNTDALRSLLAAARQRDALTLWHLLERTKAAQRAEVFDRFAALVTLPSDVTRDNILSGDRKSMNGAWDALKLGNTTWWREWKRDW